MNKLTIILFLAGVVFAGCSESPDKTAEIQDSFSQHKTASLAQTAQTEQNQSSK